MAEFSLGDAVLGTEIDLDPLDKGIDEAEERTKRGFGRIGDVVKGALSVGIAAGAGVVVAGLGAIASGIGDAREAAQVMAQTEAVIRSTGNAAGFTADEVADMAGALSAAEGMSLFGDSDIQKGQNLLLTFTNIKETLPDATQTMVDMAQALGTDVSAGAIQLGKALNDPINGITALTRVGVTFTEEQKAQIKTMQEAGDIAGAQKVILAELNKEFGGSAKAAADADGGWAKFNDRMGEVLEAVGARALPLLNKFADFLNDPLMPILENNVGPALDTIGAIIDGTVIPAFQSLQQGASANAGEFQETFTQIQDIVTTTGEIIKTVISGVTAFLRDHGTEIQMILSGAWTLIKLTIDNALAIIRGTLNAVLLLMKGDVIGALGAILQIFIDIGMNIYRAFEAPILAVGDLINRFIGWVNDGIANALNAIIDPINRTIDGINQMPGMSLEHIPRLAKGTEWFGGGMALVGERGPELVNLPRGSQVLTAPETRRALQSDRSSVVRVVVSLNDSGMHWLERFVTVTAEQVQDVTAQRGSMRSRMGG